MWEVQYALLSSKQGLGLNGSGSCRLKDSELTEWLCQKLSEGSVVAITSMQRIK